MNELDLLKVLLELKVYSQTWKSSSGQDFSCQTDFEEDHNNQNIPYIYCSQHPINVVETQCNIPINQVLCKSCSKAVPVKNAVTQCYIRPYNETPLHGEPHINDIQKHRPIKSQLDQDPIPLVAEGFSVVRKPDIDSSSSLRVYSNSNRNEINSKPFVKSKVKQLRKSVNDKTVNIEPKNDDDCYDPAGDVLDCSDDDFTENDTNDAKDASLQEDDSFSNESEKDRHFWEEMKRKRKLVKKVYRVRKKTGNEKSEKVKKRSGCLKMKKNKNLEALDDVEDEWITDDEEDEPVAEDLSLAFKAEWKEKRVPNNTHKKNFVCDVCSKPYSKIHLLRDHIIRDHKNHPRAKEFKYRCQHCNKAFVGQNNLNYHLKRHCGPCEICGVIFGCGGLFFKHRKNHDAVCEQCGKRFMTVSSLNQHIVHKHRVKSIFCEFCGKGFAYESLLKAHTHKAHSWTVDNGVSGPKKDADEVSDLNCTDCSYVAKNFLSLRVHQGMAHVRKKKKAEGDIEHTCPICNAQLTSKITFKRHMEKHSYPYAFHKCSVCYKSFPSIKKLDGHRNKVHGLMKEDPETQELHIISGDQETYPCMMCNVTFFDLQSLHQHMSSVHDSSSNIKIIAQNKIMYECMYCDIVYECDEDLQSHLLSEHGGDPTVNDEVITVTSDSLHVIAPDEEYSSKVIDLTHDRQITQTFEIPMETSHYEDDDPKNIVSLPSCSVPTDVNMVEINGVKYHVIRSGHE